MVQMKIKIIHVNRIALTVLFWTSAKSANMHRKATWLSE